MPPGGVSVRQKRTPVPGTVPANLLCSIKDTVEMMSFLGLCLLRLAGTEGVWWRSAKLDFVFGICLYSGVEEMMFSGRKMEDPSRVWVEM